MKMLNVFVAAGLALTALASQPALAATTGTTTTDKTQPAVPAETKAKIAALEAKIKELKAKIAVLEASDEIQQWNALEEQFNALRSNPRYIELATKDMGSRTSSEENEFAALNAQRLDIIGRQAVFQPQKDELESLKIELAAAEAEYATLIASLPVPNPDTAAGPGEEEGFVGEDFSNSEDGSGDETLENPNQLSPNQVQ